VVTIADAASRRLGRIDDASKKALVAFLRTPRYEVLPTEGIEERVLASVPRDVTITITASPRRGIDATIDLALRLAGHGFVVVPHLSARLIRDDSHLNEILAALATIGATDVFVVAGDAREPAGKFPDSVSLLEAITAEKHGLRDIGVTGYPERHSFIDDDLTIQAMWDKRRLATYIVSNLCFDPAALRQWIGRIRRRGVTLPLILGLAGPVDRTKLVQMATKIGVADSARFAAGHSSAVVRLSTPGAYQPERLLGRVGSTLAAPPSLVTGLHIFTFNQVQQAEQWRQRLLAQLPVNPGS
jgi:methylenetetrahydrofolate reductase (NADPH)